jgi:peptidoglycan-associated lipoprotein
VPRLCCGLLLAALFAAPAAGQTSQQPTTTTSQPAGSAPDESRETRPALPTNYGDTGFWFVPTGEVLPAGRWSTSVYRANFDRRQGLTDVSQVGFTAAVGVMDRLELFGSWRLVRLDRDVQPTFVPSDIDYGGVSHEFPYVRRGWSKTLGGPIYVGGKWNFLSQSRNQPMALAARFMVKFPTGSSWSSTNDLDGHIDLVASGEVNDQVELSGSAGWIFRGDPDQFRLSDGFKYGLGAAFPSRSPLRALVELDGELVSGDEAEVVTPLIAEDGSIAPTLSTIHDPTNFKFGAVYQHRTGWFVHGGLNYSVGTGDRTVGGVDVNHSAWGLDVRVGFHPGVKRYVPPPPPAPTPPPAAPPPPPPPPNRPPSFTLQAQCDPCSVEIGKSTSLRSEAKDPDGDTVSYRWQAPSGSFASPTERNTTWTAPDQEGPVSLTVTADDGKGGRATSSVKVQVVRAPRKTYTFEDVHFDFDRYNLRPDAVKILDEAVTALKESPDLRVTIEGHCDSIGTAEYNLALGERRANAARDYLVSRGIATNRLETVSYGEERPKADNKTEEGRALNRRAALVVKIQ